MSLSDLKARLTERLYGLDRWRAGEVADRSDYDLNPALSRPGKSLREAAVLVPVVARPEGASVLLTRRADTLNSHTGQIAFPGGRLDPGEDAVIAALREANEEIGLDRAAVEILGLSAPYETVTGFRVTPVVGWLAEAPLLNPSPAEVAEVFETPWDFLMDPANHRKDFYEQPGSPRRWYWAMPWQDRYIWGATAGMLRGLHNRLYGAEADPERAVQTDAERGAL